MLDFVTPCPLEALDKLREVVERYDRRSYIVRIDWNGRAGYVIAFNKSKRTVCSLAPKYKEHLW